MEIKKTNTIKSSIKTHDHPYLKDAWIPNYDEYEVNDLKALGDIPKDLEGAYYRNTENQVHEPIGRFHPFDGDAMIHSINFDNGKANYVNKFVKTEGFLVEQEMGKSMWAGLMERTGSSKLPGWGAQGGIKDSSSTDIIVHAGEPLTTFYQCGEGYQLNPYSLDTEQKASWVPVGGVSAHPKVDLSTGELLFFNYSKQSPYLNYGVVDKNQNLKHFVPIELPGPRLPHDMAYSKNYSIINDLPLFWDQEMLKKGIHATRLHDLPSRFAVIPRYGNPEDIKWFEADPTYVLHWNNAYEVGDELILEGYFQEHPWPENYVDAPPGLERMMAFLDFSLLKPRLHRWKFNLKTGATTEEDICNETIEFGVINQHIAGLEHRYTYSMVPTKGHFTFDGITKHDHQKKSLTKYIFPEHIFISEVSFAPKTNGIDEDDGYLVTISNDVREKSSSCLLFDAKNIEQGPVCDIPLPHQICSGTHATWAQKSDLKS